MAAIIALVALAVAAVAVLLCACQAAALADLAWQQQRDRAGHRPEACLPGFGSEVSGIRDPVSGLDPDRVRAGEAEDVGGERRIIAQVRDGVIADDVDHRRPGALGVVDVGAAIQEAGAEVEQCHGGVAGDAGMAVGGSGRDPFE